MSHFFAYVSRMKFIRRWGLMRNTQPENLQEHSQRVAMIAHALAVIRNLTADPPVSPERAALLGLYHDVPEVITGDLPTPVKHFNPRIKSAYREIEAVAAERLHRMLPEELKPAFRPLFAPEPADRELWELVKAADKICAYLKCVEEMNAGNPEFSKAARALKAQVEAIDRPEVRYFLDRFAPSFRLTLDELD